MTPSSQLPSQGLWLSPAILVLDLTPAEKIVFACICQIAVQSDKRCEASNVELAKATFIPFKTLTKLVSQLVEGEWLSATINKSQANKRTLTPLAMYLVDYTQNKDSQPEDYTQNGKAFHPSAVDYTQNGNDKQENYTQNGNEPNQNSITPGKNNDDRHRQPGTNTKLGFRKCIVTGVDIHQQHNDMWYVNDKTLWRLAEYHPPTFQMLAKRFLPGVAIDSQNRVDACRRIAKAVKQLGESGEASEPIILPLRLCPVTRIDVAHQELEKPLVSIVTMKTMFQEDRPRYNVIAGRFLTEEELGRSMSYQLELLMNRIHALANKR